MNLVIPTIKVRLEFFPREFSSPTFIRLIIGFNRTYEIQDFAAKVQTRERLEFLYLLTTCDMRGTNPKLWTAWKGSLLNQLYRATAERLERGIDAPLLSSDVANKTRELAISISGLDAGQFFTLIVANAIAVFGVEIVAGQAVLQQRARKEASDADFGSDQAAAARLRMRAMRRRRRQKRPRSGSG